MKRKLNGVANKLEAECKENELIDVKGLKKPAADEMKPWLIETTSWSKKYEIMKGSRGYQNFPK